MDFYGERVDFKELLELLKSDDDPICVHQHILTLQNQLSCCEEKQMHDFPLGGYITRLIQVLGHTIMMDFQVETKYSIMISFNFLMDIVPNAIGQIVKEGLITTTCQVIQENMAYTDLADQAAKLFIRISVETPVEMLASPAITTLMQVFDFCDIHCQTKVLELCLNVSRHAQTEDMFVNQAMPVLEWVYPKVAISTHSSDSKSSERVAKIMQNIIMSINNFYSPSKSFDKCQETFERILNSGLIETITNCIGEYSATIQTQELTAQGVDVAMDGNNSDMINTGSLKENTYTESTISMLLSILQEGCKYSNNLIANILSNNFVHVLTQLLPKEDQDQPAFTADLTSLLNQMLPQTAADQQNSKKVIVFGPRQVYPPSDDPNSHYQILKRAMEALEVQKRELYASMSQSFFEFCASDLLYKLVVLYREIIGHQFREKCISIIDKILAVTPKEIAHEKINPSSLAELVLQILATGTGQQVLVVLQITSRALQSNDIRFALAFQREGASQAIIDMTQNIAKQAEKYDKEGHLDPHQQPYLDHSESSRFHSRARGLFGGANQMHEKDVAYEIQKIKEVLAMAEASHMPPSKREMLAFAVKEKEMQLRLLVEKRNAEVSAEEQLLLVAKKKEEEIVALSEQNKKAEEGANKDDNSSAANKEADIEKQEPPKLSVLIQEQCELIVTDYLKNESFNKQIAESHGEEIQLLSKFKELAREIIDESCSAVFNCSKTYQLIEKMTGYLTQTHGMTSFEFEKSGILEALEIFLTKAPSVALIEREALRNQDRSEEMKHSEELILSTAQKQAKQQISQKEARCLLFRIKVAAHSLCTDKVGKFPLKELIHQCHQIISNNESTLFDETRESRNHLDATEAIRSLNRRDKIKIVYDPNGTLMEKANRKASGLPATEEEKKDEDSQALKMNEPALGSKAKSMALPFGHLGGGAVEPNDEEMVEEKSQVFQKRDRLFQVLSEVCLDVQHAENLWMIEDRLKRIDTLQKAKDYSQMMEKHPLRGLLKTNEEAEELAERFSQIADEEMHDLLDRISSRIDEMLDEAHSQEQFEIMKPGFVREFTDEISEMALNEDLSNPSLSLFFDMLHLEMEDKIQEHEMGVHENEDANMDFTRPEHMKTLMLVKIKAFGEMIRETKDKTIELYRVRKESIDIDQKPKDISMQEEEKKDSAQINETQKNEQKPDSIQVQPKIDLVQPPQIALQFSDVSELNEAGEAQESNQPAVEKSQEDVDMTDEQAKPVIVEIKDEDCDSKNEQSNDGKSGSMSRRRSRGLSGQLVPDKSAIDALELQDLIQKNNGSDVELQFYLNGKLMPSNTCFYEIYQQIQKDKQKKQTNPKVPSHLDHSNPSNLFRSLMMTMGRGETGHDQGITIYFRLVDRISAQQQLRKSSLIDFTTQRERTKSQAAELVSVQALNSVVQRLIDNEFSVFQPSLDDKTNSAEQDTGKKQLERALKILKVLNFITNNTFILSQTGLNFLLSRSQSGSELDDLPSKDMDLNLPLAGRGDLFHHYKLDANILKQIQDPHKLVSGGLSGLLKEIFTSCSFLFHYETKLLYFKLVSFLGVDINRSLGYLRSYQKKKAVGHQIFIPDQREERKGGNNTNELMQKEEISRENIFNEAVDIMDRIEKRKQLDIKFKDEAGTGLGPTYEFFTLLSSKIYEAKDGKMWRVSQKDRTLFPSAIDLKSLTATQVKEVTTLFRMAGTFIAKSIVDNKLIDLPISSLMWDLLLGKKLNLFDLRDFDPNQFKLLCELQTVANRKREINEMSCDQETKNRLEQGIKTASGTTLDDLSFYFTMPGYDQIELIRGGKDTMLTLDNVQEYIDMVLHSTFYDCVNLQIQAFKKGFNSVLPMDSIRTFSTKDEIETMICGQMADDADWKDINKLQQAIKPDHGFNNQSRCYNDFLRFIVEMEPDFRPKFIQWLTGSRRLPKGGFGNLENQVSINRVSDHTLNVSADEKCPSVNTCHHYVKFPEYSSYEILKFKFTQAIEYGADNFALT